MQFGLILTRLSAGEGAVCYGAQNRRKLWPPCKTSRAKFETGDSHTVTRAGAPSFWMQNDWQLMNIVQQKQHCHQNRNISCQLCYNVIQCNSITYSVCKLIVFVRMIIRIHRILKVVQNHLVGSFSQLFVYLFVCCVCLFRCLFVFTFCLFVVWCSLMKHLLVWSKWMKLWPLIVYHNLISLNWGKIFKWYPAVRIKCTLLQQYCSTHNNAYNAIINGSFCSPETIFLST